MKQKNIHHILNAFFLLWIILFGVISNHADCRSVLSDTCHEKKVSDAIKQVSILPADIPASNPMNRCREGVCCEEQPFKEDKEFLISERYPKLFTQAWDNENRLILPDKKAETLSDDACQNKIPRNNSIYLLTQTFLI